MSKIAYSKLNLKTDTSIKEVPFNGQIIEVTQYLPWEDKMSLINIVLQKAKEGTEYNPLKLDMYFSIYLVMMYTNITFTDKQREDEFKLANAINSGLLYDTVKDNIPEKELAYISSLLLNTAEARRKNYNSIAGVINDIIENLPLQAEQMQKIVDNFNPEKFQNVLDFAKSVNNGKLTM